MESLEGRDGIEMRPASEGDIPTLLKLEQDVAGVNTYSPMLTEEEWKEELRNSAVYLITAGNDVVGNFSYRQKTPTNIYISGLVISPGHQGKGIARTVLEQFLRTHPSIERFDLVTHPDNSALQLYQSLGFEVEEKKENYYGDGEPRLVLTLKR